MHAGVLAEAEKLRLLQVGQLVVEVPGLFIVNVPVRSPGPAQLGLSLLELGLHETGANVYQLLLVA